MCVDLGAAGQQERDSSVVVLAADIDVDVPILGLVLPAITTQVVQRSAVGMAAEEVCATRVGNSPCGRPHHVPTIFVVQERDLGRGVLPDHKIVPPEDPQTQGGVSTLRVEWRRQRPATQLENTYRVLSNHWLHSNAQT